MFKNIKHYDSLGQFADAIENTRTINYSRSYCDPEFCPDTFEEALQYARTGRADYSGTLAANVQTIAATIQKPITAYSRNVCGDFYDIGAVLTNEPEAFWTLEQEAPKEPIAIKIATSYACSRHVYQIENRGAAIVALIDGLSQLGHIVTVQTTRRTEIDMIYGEDIDFCATPLDLAGIANAIQNASFSRRLGFASIEKYTGNPNLCDQGYGFPQDLTAAEIGESLYFPTHGDWRHYETLESASRYVMDILKQYQRDE